MNSTSLTNISINLIIASSLSASLISYNSGTMIKETPNFRPLASPKSWEANVLSVNYIPSSLNTDYNDITNIVTFAKSLGKDNHDIDLELKGIIEANYWDML